MWVRGGDAYPAPFLVLESQESEGLLPDTLVNITVAILVVDSKDLENPIGPCLYHFI